MVELLASAYSLNKFKFLIYFFKHEFEMMDLLIPAQSCEEELKQPLLDLCKKSVSIFNTQ